MTEADGRSPANEPSLDAKLRLQVRVYSHAPDGYPGSAHADWLRPCIWGNGILMLRCPVCALTDCCPCTRTLLHSRAVTDFALGLGALQGHTNVVEDLVWQPGSAAELASVGDDYKLLFWDTRAGTTPAASLEDAHGKKDLHCVDWSSLQLELLVTGKLGQGRHACSPVATVYKQHCTACL